MPVFGAETVAQLAIVIAADSTNQDKAYCDYFRDEAEYDYELAMQNNDFVRSTCCQFDNHQDHDSCNALIN